MHHQGNNAKEDPRLRIVGSRRICSSLVLQQLLYYQMFFDIAWLTFWTVWCFSHYFVGISYRDQDSVRTVMIIIFCITEPIRLVAGWYGNLQENVPWLMLFIILSFIPLHGPVIYILIFGFDNQKYNTAVQIAQLILLEIEVVFAIYTVVRMIRIQRDQYSLFEFAMNARQKAALKPVPAVTR